MFESLIPQRQTKATSAPVLANAISTAGVDASLVPSTATVAVQTDSGNSGTCSKPASWNMKRAYITYNMQKPFRELHWVCRHHP